MKVGLVVHTGRSDTVAAAGETARQLAARGVDVVAARGGSAAHGDRAQQSPPIDVPVVAPGQFPHGLDLALSIGGDGTFLRAAYLCRDAGVPVLGANLGRVGFLTQVDRDRLGEVLDALTAGQFMVDERPTLTVRTATTGGEVSTDWALNEVSVEKSARQRVLRLTIFLAGTRFAQLPADGVVVATPTGSTAYAFSAGGPILSPRVRAVLVTPVAPHSLFDRSLVSAEDEEVHIEVAEGQEPAVVSCDGRAATTVPAGSAVHVVGGGRPVRLARISPPDFYGLVRAKFGLG